MDGEEGDIHWKDVGGVDALLARLTDNSTFLNAY